MRLPSLNALRMFDAAARRLNFGRAAEELNLTQGAVAQQVRRLETDLGRKLFLRHARGLELTAEGRTYAADIRRAMAIIDEVTRSLAPERRTLTLSVPPSFATKVLAANLPVFLAEHPEIEVEIRASEAIANFRADAVDLAIRQGAPPFGEDVDATMLCSLDLCALCSADQAPDGPTDLEVIASAHRLIYDGHAHWDSLLDQTVLAGSPQILRFNQTALALDAAANGQGVAIAPAILAKSDVIAGKLTEVWRAQDSGAQGYYIVTPSGGANSSVEAMIDWLKTLV